MPDPRESQVIERCNARAGQWITPHLYVADVRGGVAILLATSLYNGREDVEAEGARIRESS